MTSAETTADTRLGVDARVSLRARRRWWRGIGLALVWAIFLVNAAVITWLWARGDGNLNLQPTSDLINSIGRITGMLGAYLALVTLVLLARLPFLERLVGFD